ncbi:MAG: ADOP family duplicated permease [Acidobacteriota bacterium]
MTRPEAPRDPRANDLDAELRFHEEETLAELRRKGLTDDDARREAARRFGDRDGWRLRILQTSNPGSDHVAVLRTVTRLIAGVVRDGRFAWRAIRRQPLFAVSAAGIFALQACAAGVMFALLNGILLAPMPYPDAGRLVYIWGRNPIVQAGFTNLPVSDPDVEDWRHQAQQLEAVGGVVPNELTLTGSGDPERLASVAVTGDLFAALGVRALHGRTLTPDDQLAGARPVVLLGHRLWQRRFGGDERIVGRVIDLDGRAHEVVGVMPAGFAFPRVEEISAHYGFDRDVAAYVPWHPGAAGPPSRGNRYLIAAARLRAGVSIDRAEQEVRNIAAAGAGPAAHATDSFALIPFHEQAASTVRRPLVLLGGAVTVLVAIGCLNLTHLLLVRIAQRRREFATRAALGAGQAAIFRHVIVESVLLAGAGCVVGIFGASGIIRGLVALAPSDLPRLDMIHLDVGVILASSGLLFATAVLVGIAAIVTLERTTLEQELRAGSRGSSASRRTAQVLVCAEVALSTLLLLTAGLLVRSFGRVIATSPGFEAARVLTFRLALPPSRYPSFEHVRRAYDAIRADLARAPGVAGAAYTWQLPMAGMQGSTSYVRESGESALTLIHRVSPDYFTTMGIRLVRGCGLDCQTDLPAVVINQAMERSQWPDRDPIGQVITVNGARSRIAGIVSDVHHSSLESPPAPELYRQTVLRSMYLVVRSSSATTPADLLTVVRRTVAAVDPAVAPSDVRSLEERLGATIARRRFTLIGLTTFAVLATALALVGLYGITSLLVARLRREVGIRMVLGATPAGAVGLLVRRNVPMILAGVLAGTLSTLALARYLRPFLYETTPGDPATYASVLGVLIVVASLATLVPARRAARVQPVEVLAAE